jgi:hypothetical protein
MLFILLKGRESGLTRSLSALKSSSKSDGAYSAAELPPKSVECCAIARPHAVFQTLSRRWCGYCCCHRPLSIFPACKLQKPSIADLQSFCLISSSRILEHHLRSTSCAPYFQLCPRDRSKFVDPRQLEAGLIFELRLSDISVKSRLFKLLSRNEIDNPRFM